MLLQHMLHLLQLPTLHECSCCQSYMLQHVAAASASTFAALAATRWRIMVAPVTTRN
jgi:hypothetical protein